MGIVALDLGKSKSVACMYDTTSGEHTFETIRTSPAVVLELLERHRPERLVIEIGPAAGWVCDLCRESNVKVQVANPCHEAWRWKGIKRKTDRDDALKLARLSAMNQLPTVHVPAPKVRMWRELISYRHTLVVRRNAVKNSIRAMLTRRAIHWPAGRAGWTLKALLELGRMAGASDPADSRPDGTGDQIETPQKDLEPWQLMLREELDQYAMHTEAIMRIEEKLDAMAGDDGRVAMLRSIPGVGPRLAETIVAIIDDPSRFRTGKQVGCYAGLTPRQFQSGSMNRQGRISRAGPALLRALLVEVSWLGRRWNGWMREVYERALKNSPGRKKIAIVAVARRLLVVCWAMLRDKTLWRDPPGHKDPGPAGRARQVAAT
jgi:transposase